MRDVSLVLSLSVVLSGLLLDVDTGGTRKVVDDVGFCTTKEQIEKVVELSEKPEQNELARSLERATMPDSTVHG